MSRITLVALFLLVLPLTQGFTQTNFSEFQQSLEAMDNCEVIFFIEENGLNNTEYEVVKKYILKKISSLSEDYRKKALYYNTLRIIAQIRSNYNDAMTYASSLKYYADLSGSKTLSIGAVINMAFIYQEQGLYDLAIDHHFQAMELSKKYSNIAMMRSTQANIGVLKISLGQLDEGIAIYEKHRESIFTENIEFLKSFLPETYNDLCWAYTLKRKYQKATEYCDLCEDEMNKKNIYFIELDYLQNLANLEIHKGDYQKAQDLLLLSDKKVIAGNVLGRKSYQQLYQGKLFYYIGRYQDAIQELLKIFNDIDNKKMNYFNEKEAYLLLAKSYSKLGDMEKTQVYYDKVTLVDTLNQKQKTNIITQIASKEELLELEDTLNILKLKNQNQGRFIGLLIITFLILGSLGIILHNTAKRKNTKQFNALVSQLSIQNITTEIEKPTLKNIQNKAVYEERFSRILNDLQVLEKTNFFLRQDCNTYTTAKKLNTNINYLSKAIKARYDCDFNYYVNKQRIDYTIKRLKDDLMFRSYSIKAISQDVGYKSANTFVKHFKTHTKLLPSYYIKKLNS